MTAVLDQRYRLRPAKNGDGADIRALVFAVLAEFDLKPEPGGADSDLFDIERYYAGGFFDVLVARETDRVVGTVGVAPVEPQTGELRKMYLAPSARGAGLGAALLDHAMTRARELGFMRLELETAAVLVAAVRLYRKRGFLPVERADCASRCDVVMAIDLRK
ncbi:MAG: GNAT family N-acetyltransferase [Pseudomonadota bacterium]